MGYRTLHDCIRDLEAHGHLRRVACPVDPRLEAAEIQRRVFRAGGPALLLTNVRGCRFPMLCNLFGTLERVRFLFRDSLATVQKLVRLQVDPADALRRPRLYLSTPWTALCARPKRVRRGPVLNCQTTLDQLPQLVSWPGDGGAYVTLPQVYTEDPDEPGFARANLGMYRVQLSGGAYAPNAQAGMHYQIHRGMAAHHAAAIRRGQRLRVNVFVGGPPAMTVAAVMPLPEGVSELSFAGILNRRRVPMISAGDGLPIHAEADFCISGWLDPAATLPEGPFGDHLGYYSLIHEFPVFHVERVWHRPDAVWPFTVVGRPPQEDSIFGQFIHELVGPAIAKTAPGVRAVHAVDAAGVHPLLLAIGSERYVPFEPRRRPRELLALANALLGQGQLSLAKYLLIAAGEDDPQLDVRDVPAFLRHVLRRADWRRDLHFQTCTNMDTLDYSGAALNEGSKLVIAAVGPPIRDLPTELDGRLRLPAELGFRNPRVCLPGVLAVEGPAWEKADGRWQMVEGGEPQPIKPRAAVAPSAHVGFQISDFRFQIEDAGASMKPRPSVAPCASARELERDTAAARFCAALTPDDPINAYPLVVVVDDADFVAQSVENFLWTTFTRSDPAPDVYGIAPFSVDKHWGCRGSLVIDARAKPHHAPPLVEDPAVTRRVDALAAPGGPLHGIL